MYGRWEHVHLLERGGVMKLPVINDSDRTLGEKMHLETLKLVKMKEQKEEQEAKARVQYVSCKKHSSFWDILQILV